MLLNFPDYALKCLEIIEDHGYEAYFVGGCVRDGLLGRRCDDIDITTSATPQEITEMFEHTVPTGIKHGTVTVIIENINIEVTTYRTEGTYEDSRHPGSVKFVRSIAEDLSRRDFTVNALAYNPRTGLIDMFDGIGDLERKIIRTVGDPFMRFSEDALRILRAYRFASVLGFQIDCETLNAAGQLAHTVNNVSGERILQELVKLANGSTPEIAADLFDSASLADFGIGPIKYCKQKLSTLSSSVTESKFAFPLFVSLFVHDTDMIKTRLKPDNRLLKYIQFLDLVCCEEHPDSKERIKTLLYLYGEENVLLYLSYIRLFNEDTADHLLQMMQEIKINNEPYCVAHLTVGGEQLKKLGYSGSDIGHILDQLVRFVIERPEKNTPSELLNFIKPNHQ